MAERGIGDRLKQLSALSGLFISEKKITVGTNFATLTLIAALVQDFHAEVKLEQMYSEISQLIPYILALSSSGLENEE